MYIIIYTFTFLWIGIMSGVASKYLMAALGYDGILAFIKINRAIVVGNRNNYNVEEAIELMKGDSRIEPCEYMDAVYSHLSKFDVLISGLSCKYCFSFWVCVFFNLVCIFVLTYIDYGIHPALYIGLFFNSLVGCYTVIQ